MKVLTIANNKGGCGKTTTAFYLGRLLAASGQRVLMVDMDPQANLTSRLAVEVDTPTIADVLGGAVPGTAIDESIIDIGNLHLCPAERALANVALGLLNDPFSGRMALRRALRGITRYTFDVVVIDSPPELGILLANTMLAADAIIAPAEPENDAMGGIGVIAERAATIRLNEERSTPILMGTVATSANMRANRHLDGLAMLKRQKWAPLLAVVEKRDGVDRDRQLLAAYKPVADAVMAWMGVDRG